MILVIKDAKIFAIHGDTQQITFALYPSATRIIKVVDGLSLEPGMDDPTITNPKFLVEEIDAILPKLYVHLTMSGGDGKLPYPGVNVSISGQNSLTLFGSIRDANNIIIPVSWAWRIEIRRVVSENDPIPVGSTVREVNIEDGVFSIILDDFTEKGVWQISQKDFEVLRKADFAMLPCDMQVVFFGEADNKFFKVY